MKRTLIILLLLTSVISTYSQSYLKLTEKSGKKKDKIVIIEKNVSIVDLKSSINLLIDLSKMGQDKIESIRLKCYVKRDSSFVEIPTIKIPVNYQDIFPNVNPEIDSSQRRVILAISKNLIHPNETTREIEIDLKQLSFLKENDVLSIVVEENTNKSYSYELELSDLGLTSPKEIGLPLMVSYIVEDNSSAMINVGISGIWHINTRNRLQDYFGFGITLTPNSVDLADLKNSNIGIIPTISLGLGRKNPDILFLGYGYVVGLDKPMCYAALNLAWISRVIKR